MRNRVTCLLLTFLLTLYGQSMLHAQTITIDNANFNSANTYGAGGSITVPIKLSGNFSLADNFQLFLSDASGNFSNPKLIGGYNSFFTPFVNGIIPTGTAAGNGYKIKVVSTSTNKSAVTAAFSISNGGSIINNLDAEEENKRNDSTYGKCPLPGDADSIDIVFDGSASAVTSFLVLDSGGNKVTGKDLPGNSYQFRTAKNNYYVIQATTKKAGVISVRSFLVLRSSTNAGIQTSGKIEICLPASAAFSVNYTSAGGIQYNYPSTVYTVKWGDSSTTTKLSQTGLIGQNGILSHQYDTISCGQQDIDTTHNAFLVQINAQNSFCPTNFLGTNSTVKVFQKPTAIIDPFAINCFGDSITVCGTSSDRGRAAPNNALTCGSNPLTYKWYVNNSSLPKSTDSCFVPKFSEGSNTIKLVVNNGTCQHDTTVIICIDPRPLPSFKVNNQDAVTGCAPLTVATTNNSNKNTCGKTVYHWFVTDSAGVGIPAGAAYSVSPNDSAVAPQYVFKIPAKYYIHMYFLNTCTGPFIYDTVRVVNLIGFASVNLPDTQKYCGLKVINFQTDPNHKVTYNSNQGNETYKWTVTGGTKYTFVGGTTSASRYPQIQFDSFGTYTVAVAFHNNCGDKSASQVISFSAGITANATGGSKDTVLCYSVNNIQLLGSTTGKIDSIKWATDGKGSFAKADTIKTVYNFAAYDKNNGVTLLLSAFAKPPSACRLVQDSLHISFKAANTNTDVKQVACSGPVSYTPTSSIDGSTYTWNSSVTAGNAKGNKPSGSGNISDVLTNTSQKDSAAVQYTITPFADGCKGQPYKFTAIIYPTPVIAFNKHRDSICSGASVGISAFDSLLKGGFTYNVVAPNTVSGYSSQPGVSYVDTLRIQDKLSNNGSTDTTVLYIITAYGQLPATCMGNTDTVRITVRAGSTAANAGNDIGLCNDTVTLLAGNQPGPGESGLWSQVQGPANATIIVPAKFDTKITGLKPGTYLFQWHINSLKCLSSNDTVVVVNTPRVNNKVPDTTVSVCKGSTISLQAPQSTGGDGTFSYQWQQSLDSVNWADIPNQITAGITFVPDATVYIRRMAGSGNCLVASKGILVIVKPSVNNNTIAANQSVCINNSADTIRGTIPSGGDGAYNYSWQQSTDGVNYQVIPGAAGRDYYPGVVDTTLYFMRTVNSTLCGGLQGGPTSNAVVITLHKNAVADFTATATKGCTPFQLQDVITNNGHPDVNGNYFWYVNNTSVGSGLAFPGYAITTSNDSVSVKLKAVSAFGCLSDSLSIKFYSFAKPVTSFNLSDTAGCGPLTVHFTNTTSNRNFFQYTWDFGNGTTSNVIDTVSVIFPPSPSFTDTIYKVTLSALTVCDNIVYQKDILVSSKPKASFTPDSSFNCSPRDVVFTNNSAGNRVTYIWNFGDGSAPEVNNSHTVLHTFHTGTAVVFRVQLIAVNNCGSDTAYFNVGVQANSIDLHFSEQVGQKFGCTGQAVTFVNNTKGATLFHWNFGDPASGSNDSLNTQTGIGTVAHLYNQPGTYTITLCAANGCVKDTCTTQVVEIKQNPKAAFTAQPVESCAGDTVHFTNRSLPADGSLLYTWYFGDGVADSAGVNPTHVYGNAGKDTVVLVAKAVFPLDFSCRDTATTIITVNGPVGELHYPDSVCLGSPLTFTAVSSNTSTYQFFFGDGTNSAAVTNPVISHTYSLPGKYVPYVILTTGNCSKTIQTTDTIRVDSVKAAFAYNLTSYCDSTAVLFTDKSFSSFGIKSWGWMFGDNKTGAGQNQQHTYTATNNYPVILTVQTNFGCISVDSINIPIQVKGKPAFSIQSDSIGCIGQPVVYTAVGGSVDPVSFYNWTFTNNVSLNGISVTNYYATARTETATLITGTAQGCYDTATRATVIKPSPFVKVGNDQTICKGKAVQLTTTSDVTPLYWSPADTTLSCTVCSTTLAAPVTTTQYNVSGTNTFGCTTTDTVLVTVVQPTHISITGDTLLCIGDSTRLFGHGADQYNWSPSTGIADGITNMPSALFQPSITTQYRVIGNDNNNCFFDTAYVTVAVGNYPKISLGADQVQSTGTLLPLASSATNGPITKWLWQPPGDLNCDTCAVPVAHIKKNICYTVAAANNYGCTGYDTLCITVFCESGQVFIPNAFTPDGDGKNDILMVRAKGVKIVKSFRIFSRWGQVVFERSNFIPNDAKYGWDGSINGKISQQDVFVYTCEVECEDGTKFTYKGNTAVIKQ